VLLLLVLVLLLLLLLLRLYPAGCPLVTGVTGEVVGIRQTPNLKKLEEDLKVGVAGMTHGDDAASLKQYDQC
jgi:hypothetical protein